MANLVFLSFTEILIHNIFVATTQVTLKSEAELLPLMFIVRVPLVLDRVVWATAEDF